MATDQSDDVAFHEIDWDSVQENRRRLPTGSSTVEPLAYVALFVAVLYDYYWLGNRVPTVNLPVIARVDVPIVSRIGPVRWDVLSIEWLSLLLIALMTFRVAVPLYRNRRLTYYYWRRFSRNRMAVLGLGYLGVLSVVALLGPVFMNEPQVSIETLNRQLRPPVYVTASPTGETVTGTWKYPLGTDGSGISMVKWIVFGAKVSLQVGLIATMLSIGIGTAVGATAAHMGGMVDEVLTRYIDIQATFPTFLLLILLIYLYGGSLLLLIFLFGFFSWESTARLVRSEALQRTEEEYVQAAEATGASQAWIIRRHIVPNVSRTAITDATLSIPFFILQETTLSFLGFADDSIFSWGQIIASGNTLLVPEFAWWVTFFPGFVLFVTVLAFMYVGDAVNDAVDPRGD